MTGFDSKQRMAADKLHWSDCAVYNGLAYSAGECDCGVTQEPASYLHTVLSAFGPNAGISLDQKGWSQLHTAIKAALAQQAQEPVARVSGTYGGRFTYDPINPAAILPIGMALYAAAQREWAGLTNDEVNNFAAGCHLGKSVQGAIYEALAKLKEKNT